MTSMITNTDAFERSVPLQMDTKHAASWMRMNGIENGLKRKSSEGTDPVDESLKVLSNVRMDVVVSTSIKERLDKINVKESYEMETTLIKDCDFKYDDSRGYICRDALRRLLLWLTYIISLCFLKPSPKRLKDSFFSIFSLVLDSDIVRYSLSAINKSSTSTLSDISVYSAVSAECSSTIPQYRRSSFRATCAMTIIMILCVFPCVSEAKPMSETLQRAYANSRGPSPGAKKLLNIPEDGVEPIPGKHLPLPHDAYEAELERDHALPTSMPNADILKTNSNPLYQKPRPPQHHGASILAGAGAPPSYAPPSRAFFTPPLPPEYLNPFADKPTLRGTNAESGNYLNRRPIPPPSLVPGHERIPIRPGQETPAAQVPSPPIPSNPNANANPSTNNNDAQQKKKALNTPSHKVNADGSLDASGLSIDDIRSQGSLSSPDQANFTDYVPNSLNIPTISRILSGSNGRKEDIPDILLRTVTTKPTAGNQNQDQLPRFESIPKNQSTILGMSEPKTKGPEKGVLDKESSTEGSVLPVLEPDMGNLDRPLIVDNNGESNTRRNLQFATSKHVNHQAMDPNLHENINGKNGEQATATLTTYVLKDHEVSTEHLHNLANSNSEGKTQPKPTKGSNSVTQRQNSVGVTWPVAWNLHIYLATVFFTILAVYSIFKIICYNKFTHLFTQYYFIILHLILVLVCLMRIFYMCYDPYNINNSLPMFLSEILLHVPEIFLSIAFAASILFLLTNSINFKNSCYSFIVRPRTIIIGGSFHIIICIILHLVENTNSVAKNLDKAEKRILGLVCQVLYILIAFILGILYLYVYRKLKKVLQKKSHSYIHGFQNLYQAIHINLATAMLFVLLGILQIYGICGINIQLNMTKFNWLQWGYQFSLRLIEISVVALISWVISLKVGIVASLQHEKTDGHKIPGLSLFPCTASSSNEQFESDYPAICNTNTNLHTYTLRTGKPIYDASVLGSHLQGMSDQCCSSGMEGQRFQINSIANCDNGSLAENYSGHSSIANAAHSSSTESSNATSSQGVTNHLIKAHNQVNPNHMHSYLDNVSASEEHYSNCEPNIQNMDPSGSDSIDHEYNVIQYGSNSDFVRDINHKNNGTYGNNSIRGSKNNFKHLSFDRLSSRNNSGHNLSNPRKKHKKQNSSQKGQQNCMTLGYDPNIHHYHHPHVNDVGEYGYPSDTGSFHTSGIQTLNPMRNYYDPSAMMVQGPSGGRDSQRRGRANHSPTTSVVNSSGSQKRGKNINHIFNNQQDHQKSDLYGFSDNPNERSFTNATNQSHGQNFEQENDERNGSSMLVAQDGFVRFRALEDGQT